MGGNAVTWCLMAQLDLRLPENVDGDFFVRPNEWVGQTESNAPEAQRRRKNEQHAEEKRRAARAS